MVVECRTLELMVRSNFRAFIPLADLGHPQAPPPLLPLPLSRSISCHGALVALSWHVSLRICLEISGKASTIKRLSRRTWWKNK